MMSSPACLGWLLAPAAAIVAGALALAPLGQQVLQRRMVFLDLALAQLAACGALAAAMALDHPPPMAMTMAAAVAALAGAAVAARIGRLPPEGREARVGLLYVAGAAAAVLLATADPHGREHLLALLAGDVLWAAWTGVAPMALAAVLLLLLAVRGRLARGPVFYPAFALTLSVAVPLLGLYLVFALLVTPAIWARRGLRPTAAAAGSALLALMGLALSAATDWPSSATITLVLAIGGLLAGPPSRSPAAPALPTISGSGRSGPDP